jgi:hypothetical protein
MMHCTRHNETNASLHAEETACSADLNLNFSVVPAGPPCASMHSIEGDRLGMMQTCGLQPSLPRVPCKAATSSIIRCRPHRRQLLCTPFAQKSDVVMSSFDSDANWGMVLPPNKWVLTSCMHAKLAVATKEELLKSIAKAQRSTVKDSPKH